MWYLYALLSAIGSSIGSIAARAYSSSEAFHVIFWDCILLGIISLIASKVLHKQWISIDALPLGIWYAISGGVGISSFIFALQAGGKIGPVSIISTGLPVILASIVSYIFFKETLSTGQLVGMIMALIGFVLVIKG